PYFEQVLAIKKKVLGSEHPSTAISLNNLGTLLHSQGDYAAARPYLEQALAIWKKGLGSEHPHTAGGYRNLARALHTQGRHAEAEEMATAAATSFHAARLRISFGGLERTTFTTEHSPLRLLAALLARNGKPLLAWQRLEENLARGLLDDLAARQRYAGGERDRLTSLLGRLQKLDERIAALMARRADAAPLASEEDARRKKIEELRKERDGLQLELTKFQAELEKKHGPAAGEV